MTKQPFVFSLPWDAESPAAPPPYCELCLFGAGGRGQAVLRQLNATRPDLRIVAFIDNAATGKYGNIPILNLDAAISRYPRSLIIITSFWEAEIADQLKRAGIKAFLVAKENNIVRPFEHYPQPTEIIIQHIQHHADDSITINLLNGSGSPFYLRYRVGNSQFHESPDATMHVDPLQPGVDTTVAFLPKDQQREQWQSISLRLCPSPYGELDEEMQRLSPGAGNRFLLVLHNGMAFRPESWLASCGSEPDNSDSLYARHRWGGLGQYTDAHCAMVSLGMDVITDTANLTTEFFDVNRELRLSPLQLLCEVNAGSASMKCGNVAEAIAIAGRSLGYTIRTVHLIRDHVTHRGQTLIGGGHVVNELYCSQREHWIFMDCFSHVLGARIGESLLSTTELLSFIHSARRSVVELLVYEPGDAHPKWMPFIRSPLADRLKTDYSRQQHIRFGGMLTT
jgi:hypothetical protein